MIVDYKNKIVQEQKSTQVPGYKSIYKTIITQLYKGTPWPPPPLPYLNINLKYKTLKCDTTIKEFIET